jgi:Protein of unknown function (DUF1214)
VDLYFGPRPPSGLESNWIPTSGDFFLWFRLYGPEQPVLVVTILCTAITYSRGGTFWRRLAASSKEIFNLAGGPHLYPPQNWVPHISILRCGHSRKRSAPTHLYHRDKAFTPHPSATHPQLLLLGNGK